MSRLDSFIRRLEAQRACLDWAIVAIRDVPGIVLELGLGNGRPYDHLRAYVGNARQILAFDRQLAAHPDCVPDKAHLLLGDFKDTLPTLWQRLAGGAALIHADAGSGDAVASQAQACGLPALVDPVLAAGGIVLSDQDMAPPASLGWKALPMPRGVKPGRYHLYSKA